MRCDIRGASRIPSPDGSGFPAARPDRLAAVRDRAKPGLRRRHDPRRRAPRRHALPQRRWREHGLSASTVWLGAATIDLAQGEATVSLALVLGDFGPRYTSHDNLRPIVALETQLPLAGTGSVTATLTFGGIASETVTFTNVPANETVRFVLLGSDEIRSRPSTGPATAAPSTPPDAFTLLAKTGTRYRFDAQGLLQGTIDRNENRVTDPEGRVTKLTFGTGDRVSGGSYTGGVTITLTPYLTDGLDGTLRAPATGKIGAAAPAPGAGGLGGPLPALVTKYACKNEKGKRKRTGIIRGTHNRRLKHHEHGDGMCTFLRRLRCRKSDVF
jgi:hypothetical protein